ncbi:uncharacterized protein N7477_007846 [Penicillium maclennaniae]|uniref:uncharacterized protein n=1 Tax=Penicillium maclennaniae TaxID=1343394 RepID=UPI00254050AE|nr:uncharacterized protein N7477_007846 [Penicillium maclennaniae]KAJ5665398.1 hypothetical protein N7477_007846 [Penicillium maclennaniae]
MSLTSRVLGLFSTTENSDSNTSNAHDLAGSTLNQPTFGFDGQIMSGGAARHAQDDLIEEEPRPPYLHAMLAGGIGGCCGDMLMHSLDTVKTRQQGDPTFPPKYTSMGSSYATIYRQEGLCRGLYSGVTPAFLGSFPGTVIFFGVYEFTKRLMLDSGINPSVAYLSGGFFADLAASVVYVPSEVLKTRLQLQGRYNNPHFHSGYNYHGTTDAFRTIVRREGYSALFHGYKATIFRDLPFSALQFAFYEQEQALAKNGRDRRRDGWCHYLSARRCQNTHSNTSESYRAFHRVNKHETQWRSQTPRGIIAFPRVTSPLATDFHLITLHLGHTPGTPRLDTSSVFTGLRMIYRTEGLAGWFRGVGPRGVWTSIQSGTMLVMYQYLLKQLESWQGLQAETPL